MADVLGIPRRVDGQSYYEPQSSSGLIRSVPSSSNLFAAGATSSPSPSSSSASSSPKPSDTTESEQQDLTHDSPLSTTPSSPPESAFDFSETFSRSSTPASSGISLEHKYASDDEPDFADFDKTQFTTQHVESATPTQEQPNAEQVPSASATESTISDSPLATPAVADDTAIKVQPSRHVDYLSHDWKEEDIWASWRHIVSQRRVYGQRSRLENASWRTWAKSKYKLATISPETLNWLKESDVTWLYGPLKPATSYSHGRSEPASHLSKSNSFVNPKKPILKKRSMSEVMLQKSISTSSLVQQAAMSVQAQGRQRRIPQTDIFPANYPSESPSREPTDYFSSRSESSNGESTPCDCQPRRHIRFDDTVEQCIAIDGKPEDDSDDSSSDSDSDFNHHRRRNSSSSSSSDDGVVMMKRRKRSSLRNRNSNNTRNNRSSSQTPNGGNKKIIEPLPNTTLKYRTDSPETAPPQPNPPQPFGRSWGAGHLSPSPSQETLKPTRPSRNFLLNEDSEEEGEGEESTNWSFGASNPKSALGASSSSSDLEADSEIPVDAAESKGKARAQGYGPREYGGGGGSTPGGPGEFGAGMRRTNSGMFMPYEEDEDDEVAAGLFGRVNDTINTARDIAHVIWNVGWRK